MFWRVADVFMVAAVVFLGVDEYFGWLNGCLWELLGCLMS